MRLASAVYKAETVSGPKSAATLYNDVEYELALGGGGSEDDYEKGEDALGILRRRFPDVERQARQISAPPRTSRAASETLHGGRRRRETPSSQQRPQSRKRKPPREQEEQPAPASRARHVARETGRELSGLGRETSRRAGSAASQIPTGGWGELVSFTILGGIGLSLLYLALTKTKGISELMLGVTNSVAAIISPHVDPLTSPRSAGSTASVRGTGTSRPVLPRSAPLAQGITITKQATTVAKGLIP